ncbi:family 16 glycoside hydrolase [Streptomyces sp. Ru87]|uniref:OmpL47-type beta-barrel domain-containing protein n=1 Tax=Streptomyces sp. Ru87 TaxID=2044307 RepID=UPI000BF7F9AE|nr:family 16 glycoside hydrolase [Streptomyces sp. Ru87]PGH47689.1 glycosyl hydrolase [Streptomyces sp. Ru87]
MKGTPVLFGQLAAPRRALAVLVTALLAALCLTAPPPAYGKGQGGPATAADQVLTWTADNDMTRYKTAPQTAVAGPATIVFENSEATGNTSGLPHTLTFDSSDPQYNTDVDLNILANPSDANGGRHTAEVNLTPGTYHYLCTIPGHGAMQGVLVVTDPGGGEDTTAPEVTAELTGQQNADGAYIGGATAALTATDDNSGVESIEYALDGGDFTAYTGPVAVDEVGEHSLSYRATDKAGNASEAKTVDFTVVEPPTDDTTAPETSAEVTGERDADGGYLGTATVTVSASDSGSGVDTVEYALDGGDFAAYTAPVAVDEVGEHSLSYRATDKAGNVSEAKSVDFTVVEPPTDDTTAPEISAEVTGERDADGGYLGTATVTVTATDAESGVAAVQYSLNGGPYLAYSEPLTVDRPGDHTVRYRAVDKAGNTATAKTVDFTVVEAGGTEPDCPESDNRRTVIVGTVDTGVPNRVTGDGCTVNELIEDERAWGSHADFVRHVTKVADGLAREGVVDERERDLIVDAARESAIGTPGHDTGYRSLFDGSAKSFNHWDHVGGGAFGLNGDGTMSSSTTVDGMGMLWYPDRQFGDFSLKLQFRDDAPADGRANSGVFVRFPDPNWHHGESRPEWVAIKYGHELQILDRPDGDQYKTGSVYGFDRVGLDDAGVTEKGVWNDYEIRVVDQRYWVFRNGVLLNWFDNDPGLLFNPPRSDDPGTAGRQYQDGFIGLQTHSTTDAVSFRNIRIQEL